MIKFFKKVIKKIKIMLAKKHFDNLIKERDVFIEELLNKFKKI